MEDEAKKGSDMFCSLMAQIVWLSRELSRARILPDQDRCCRCKEYGPETCARCWREMAVMETAKEMAR